MTDQTVATARVDIVADASTFTAEVQRAQGRLSAFSAEAQAAYGAASASSKRAASDLAMFVATLGKTPEEVRLLKAEMRGVPTQFLEEARKKVQDFRSASSVAAEEARKLVEQEKRLAADQSFVKALQDRANAAGRSAADILELQAAERGLSDQAAPYIARLRQQDEALRAAADETRRLAEQERRLSADRSFIKGLQDRSNAIGKTTADILEMQAAERGLSDQAAPYIARLREAEVAQRGVGVSSKEMAWAMRGVPAQISDIAVSLQGGMPVMTVFMQQGFQLRDMFHGWVPAAKAVGSTLLGMINPFTVAVAAVGALAYGYYAGAKEDEEFRKSIILTNGAMGLNAGALRDMAARLDDVAGTRAKAAEVLNLFARDASVSASSLERYAQSAIEWERATGQAAEEIVKQFSELKNEPLKASEKLNESMRYLTGETYRQIRLLEEAGKKTEAANLSQREYDKTLRERTPQILANLGYVERAWRAIKEIGAEAIDDIKSIGRDQSVSQQLAEAVADYEKNFGESDDPNTYRGAWTGSRSRNEAQQRIAALQELARWEASLARQNQANERARALGVEREEYILDGRTKSQLQSAELAAEKDKWQKLSAGLEEGSAKYRELYAAHQENVRKITEQYADKGLAKASESLQKWLAEQGIAVAASDRLTEAYVHGGAAVSELARQQQIEEQVLKHGTAAREQIAAAVDAHGAALDRLDIAKQLDQLRLQNTAAASYIDVLKAQSQGLEQGRAAQEKYNDEQALAALLVGKNADEVEALTKRWKEQRAVANQLGRETGAMSEINRLVESTRTKQEAYNYELERLVNLRPYVKTAEQVEAVERAIENLQREHNTWFKLTEDALNRIDESFASMWKGLIDGSENAFDAMKGGFDQMLAEMAHAAITRPIIVTVGNTIMGTNTSGGIADVWSLSGASDGPLAGPGSIMSPSSWQMPGDMLRDSMINWAGKDGTLGSIGTWGLENSKVLGNIADGLGYLGGALGAWKAFDSGRYGTAAGTAIGTALLPGVGSAVGGLVGGLVDSVFGFGDSKPKTRHSNRVYAGLADDGTFDIRERDSRQTDDATKAAAALAESNLRAANALIDRAGIDARFESFFAIMESSILGDRNGVASGGTIRYGDQTATVGISDRWDKTKDGFGGWSDAEMLPRLATDIQMSIVEAFQRIDLMPKTLAGIDVRGLDAAAAQSLVDLINAAGALSVALDDLPLVNLIGLTLDASAALLQAAGSTEAFISAQQSFVSGFYSEAEQFEISTNNLARGLRSINGQALPETRDAWREMVEAVGKVTDEESARTYVALTNMSSAADAYYTHLEQLAGNAVQAAADAARAQADLLRQIWTDATSAGEAAYSGLSSSINTEKARLQNEAQAVADALRGSVSTASTTVSELNTLVNRLKSTVASMTQGQPDEQRAFAWAQSRVEQALSVARLTGVMPSSADFESALQIVANPSEGLYGSFEDYYADYLKTAHTVSELNDLAGDQLSTEERALKALNDQLSQSQYWYNEEISRLDALLEAQRQSLDIAQGTYQQELSIGAAIERLTGAINAINAAAPIVAPGGSGPQADPKGGAVADWYRTYLGRSPTSADDVEGVAFWTRAIADLGIDAARESFLRSARENNERLPGFAVGTNYVPHDMNVRIHEGERVVPAADNRLMMKIMQSGAGRSDTERLLQQEMREMRLMMQTLLDENNRLTRRIADSNVAMADGRATQSVQTQPIVKTVMATPGQ